ncbi:MAG: SpoIIE family protein phosphatase, partial [Clostridia bacterium]|nr:SpoIIE family protein phosphatase [Clostridia bacterium]
DRSLIPLSIFCSWAVAIAAVSRINRFLTVAAVLVTDFLLGAFFVGYPVYGYVEVLNILIPGVAFCAIPNRLFQKISKQIEIDKSANGILLANVDREFLFGKLMKTSKLLQNMGENYQKIGVFENKNIDAKVQVATEAMLRTCKNCENYARCMREHAMQSEIVKLAEIGLSKSKISLLDISKDVAMFCCQTSNLISAINYSVLAYARTEKLIETEDTGRIAVGDQLLGTSRMLCETAKQLSFGASVDVKLSEIVYDELLAENIVAKDVSVLNGKNFAVTMIVRIGESEQQIEKILKSVLKFEVQTETVISKYSGYKLLKLTPKPKFDVAVGVASHKKEEFAENGDNFSVIELDDNRVLIAICDGMGGGEKANTISEKVLELVEDFYRAGFDSELILKNISHLVSTSQKEMYSTLDVCVFDKKTGNADFVKASAPPTVCKSGDSSSFVFGEALPIGIVETTADTSMKILRQGDVVVLASDGVVDAFSSDDEYLNYVNNSQII